MPSPLALRSVASTARAARAGRTFAAGVLVRGALWPLAGFTVRHLAPHLCCRPPAGASGSWSARRWSAQQAPRPRDAPAACAPCCCRTRSQMLAGCGPRASGSAARPPDRFDGRRGRRHRPRPRRHHRRASGTSCTPRRASRRRDGDRRRRPPEGSVVPCAGGPPTRVGDRVDSRKWNTPEQNRGQRTVPCESQ